MTDKKYLHAAAQAVGKPIAFVPMHPRNGPLWSDTYAADSFSERSPNYPRMALYGDQRSARAIGEAIVADVERLLAMEAAFLVSLAENGLPADMGELLVRGDAKHGIPPRLVQKAIKAALATQPPASDVKPKVRLVEDYPLSLSPDSPLADAHQVMDADTAYIFQIMGSRERAEAIVATLNDVAARPPAAPVETDSILDTLELLASDQWCADLSTVSKIAKEAADEIKRLRHDIERYVAIASEAAPIEPDGEIDRLRDALSIALQYVPLQSDDADTQAEIDRIHDLVAGRIPANSSADSAKAITHSERISGADKDRECSIDGGPTPDADGQPPTLWKMLRKHGVGLYAAQMICNDVMLNGVSVPSQSPAPEPTSLLEAIHRLEDMIPKLRIDHSHREAEILHNAIHHLSRLASFEDPKTPGMVSVGLLNTERATSDRLRAENDQLRAEVSRAQPQIPTWQQIETAPKDGSRILATGGGLAETVEVVTYNERVGCWSSETCTLDDTDHEPQGYNRPTHWQPMPDTYQLSRPHRGSAE